MSGLHRSEEEFLRLRHELELTRKELSAAVELHERAGTMIAEALGRHALTHQVGWLYEDYAADIRSIVDREERVAVENVVLKRRLNAAHVPGEMCPTYLAAKGEWEVETSQLRAALVTALEDVKRGLDGNEKLVAALAEADAYLLRNHSNDHVCAQCVPGGSSVVYGFTCAWHAAKWRQTCASAEQTLSHVQQKPQPKGEK